MNGDQALIIGILTGLIVYMLTMPPPPPAPIMTPLGEIPPMGLAALTSGGWAVEQELGGVTGGSVFTEL